MIASPAWRDLLYTLSVQYPKCLMVNYALQQIADAGHLNELSAVPAAGGYYAVLTRLILSTLRDLNSKITVLNEGRSDTQIQIEAQKSIQDTMHKLVKLCCFDAHTYLFSLCVFWSLSQSSPHALYIMHIFNDISTSAQGEHGVFALRVMLNVLGCPPSLDDTIINIILKNDVSTGNIMKMHSFINMYGRNTPTDRVPPPPIILADSRIFHALLKMLFTGQRPHADVEAAAVDIVSYASAIDISNLNDAHSHVYHTTREALINAVIVCRSASDGDSIALAIPKLKVHMK